MTTPTPDAYADLRKALAGLGSSEPPWFIGSPTPSGLVRVHDGRSDGLCSFYCEAHVARAVTEAVNAVPTLLTERDELRKALAESEAAILLMASLNNPTTEEHDAAWAACEKLARKIKRHRRQALSSKAQSHEG